MVAQNQGIGQKITEIAILLQTQKEATITAINLAIPAAINLAEFIKHRVKGLHQLNSFEKIQDSMKTRLTIKLSFNVLDVENKGYQPPIPDDQVTEKTLEELKKPPQRTYRDFNEDDKGAEGGERRRGRGFRRSRRPYAWRNKDEGERDKEKEREDFDRPRGRRPRRVRRGDPPRRGGRSDRVEGEDKGYGERKEGNRGYRSRGYGGGGYGGYGGEGYGGRGYGGGYGDSDNAFGRSSRGRAPRGRRPRRVYESNP